MNDHELASKSYQLIKQDFGLEEDFDSEVDSPVDRLEQLLTKVIVHLLDKDFSRLLNALYRIDVDEKKVKEILALSVPDQMANELAKVIIAREQEKVKWREKNRN
jgi:hypothetical protein